MRLDMNKKKKFINNLPVELIHYEVLPRLPVKSLLRFKCVSKPWCNLISSSNFVKLHHSLSLEKNPGCVLLSRFSLHTFDFQHPHCPATELYCPEFLEYKEEDESIPRPLEHEIDPLQLIGSCNGLVCYYDHTDSETGFKFVLYNPATREMKELPRLHTNYNHSHFHIIGEFGYDSMANDYKVLTVFNYPEERHLYSLNSNSWEQIKNPVWKRGYETPFVAANNSVYWLNVGEDNNGADILSIKKFDFNTRVYYQFPIPDSRIAISEYPPRLASIRGKMHLVTVDTLWVLNDNCGTITNPSLSSSSWTPLLEYSELKYSELWHHHNIVLLPEPILNWDDSPLEGRKIYIGSKKNPSKFDCVDLRPGGALQEVEIKGVLQDHDDSEEYYVQRWVPSLVSLK